MATSPPADATRLRRSFKAALREGIKIEVLSPTEDGAPKEAATSPQVLSLAGKRRHELALRLEWSGRQEAAQRESESAELEHRPSRLRKILRSLTSDAGNRSEGVLVVPLSNIVRVVKWWRGGSKARGFDIVYNAAVGVGAAEDFSIHADAAFCQAHRSLTQRQLRALSGPEGAARWLRGRGGGPESEGSGLPTQLQLERAGRRLKRKSKAFEAGLVEKTISVQCANQGEAFALSKGLRLLLEYYADDAVSEGGSSENSLDFHSRGSHSAACHH